MNYQTVTFNIPDELYNRIEDAAAASQRSLDAITMEVLPILFDPSVDNEDVYEVLKRLPEYSDIGLWAVVYRRLTLEQSTRSDELIAKSKEMPLSSDEEHELDALVDLVEDQMLLRSEALLLLKQRGQDVTTYIKMPMR